LKNFRKYFFIGLKITGALIVLLCISVFVYVSVNKESIIKQVTREVSEKLNGNLTVGKVELSFIRNFPAVSVLMHDVSLTDTMISRHKHTFFQAKEVFISLAITRLIRKQPPLKGIRIDNGQVYMYTDTAGYTNKYLMKGKSDSTTGAAQGNNEFKKIELNNVRIVVNDETKQKFHDLAVKDMKVYVNYEKKRINFSAKSDIQINNMGFNTSRGSFLKDKKFNGNFVMHVDRLTKQLSFNDIRVKIAGHPFILTGAFDLAGTDRQFRLQLQSRDIDYALVKSFMPDRIKRSLSIVQLDRPLDVNATISGPLRGGDPLVIANMIGKNTILKTPFLDFDHASFKGYFTNEVVPGFPRKDPNSKIEITEFTAGWHGLPISSSKIQILNLTVPLLTCDLASDFELAKLNDLIGSNSLQLQKGNAMVRLNYSGPIERNNNTNSFLNGEVSFKNGLMVYAPRDVEMKNVNGKLLIRNSNVFIENLQTVVFGQRIVMNGEAQNLLTLINTQPDKANIDWRIYSPSLDLSAFTYLLRPRKKLVEKNQKQLAAAASKIDRLLEEGKLHVILNAKKLIYKKFDASNAEVDVTLLQDRYLINNVSMNHAGGNMNLSGSLINQRGNHYAQVKVNMKNVDVSTVFRSFDNFGQDGITSQSLEGKLNAKADAGMLLDGTGKIIPSTLVSVVDFSLKEGALNNYEPVKKLQRFVFKNRDFDNIRFAELKNRLEIRNQEVKINRMEVQSSVMTMYVEGIYGQNGTTDMSIQVPLSNLKKRGEDYNPENLGSQKKGGSSIYIRGRPGPDGNVKFKLDLFNRYDKQKAKEKI
jgi:hypothetical protein